MEDAPEHCPRNLPVKTLLTGGLVFDGSGKCLLAHLLVRVTLTNHRRLTPKLMVSELRASANRFRNIRTHTEIEGLLPYMPNLGILLQPRKGSGVHSV